MAPQNPPNSLGATAPRPIFFYRFDEVLATRRRKAAAPAEQWTEGKLVNSDHEEKQPAKHRIQTVFQTGHDTDFLNRRSTRQANSTNDRLIRSNSG
jgi:hypothetical protein